MTDRRREWARRTVGLPPEKVRELVAGWSDDQLHAAIDWLRGESFALDPHPDGAKHAALADVLLAEYDARGPTVRQARRAVEGALMNGGSTCACCGRIARAYRRKFSGLMAASIIWLVRRAEWQKAVCNPVAPDPGGEEQRRRARGWVRWAKDCPDTVHRMHEISRLVAFGLAEECTDPGWSGWYRPTAKGAQFVADPHDTIPSAVWTWDNRAIALDGDPITLREALGVEFVLEDLFAADLNDGTRWVRRDPA